MRCSPHWHLVTNLLELCTLILIIGLNFHLTAVRINFCDLQVTKVGSYYSEILDIIFGVPQGSVLGLLLFDINAIYLFLIEHYRSDFSNYADDTTQYNCGNTFLDAISDVETTIDNVFDWFCYNNFKVNPFNFRAPQNPLDFPQKLQLLQKRYKNPTSGDPKHTEKPQIAYSLNRSQKPKIRVSDSWTKISSSNWHQICFNLFIGYTCCFKTLVLWGMVFKSIHKIGVNALVQYTFS